MSNNGTFLLLLLLFAPGCRAQDTPQGQQTRDSSADLGLFLAERRLHRGRGQGNDAAKATSSSKPILHHRLQSPRPWSMPISGASRFR